MNIIYIIFTLVFIVLILLFVSAMYAALVPKFPVISTQTRKAIGDTLTDITNLLEKNQIKHSIIGGTLLGAVRWKGPIPWDNDIDICVEVKDMDKIIELFPDARKTIFGLTITYPDFMFDIFELHWEEMDNVGRVLRFRPNTMNPMMESWRKREYFISDEWDSVCRQLVFEDKLVYGPKDAYPYLNRAYSNWENEVVVHPMHEQKHIGVVRSLLSRSVDNLSRFPRFCVTSIL